MPRLPNPCRHDGNPATARLGCTSRYEVVTVDVGRFNKNLQVPARYGITARLEGVPALLVVNPRTNKLLNAGHVTALADARSMTPQGLADWLALWPKR